MAENIFPRSAELLPVCKEHFASDPEVFYICRFGQERKQLAEGAQGGDYAHSEHVFVREAHVLVVSFPVLHPCIVSKAEVCHPRRDD